jgi:hypothetical protein
VLGGATLATAGVIPKITATRILGESLLAQGSITGLLTFAKTGTTARTATFPDAAITVAGLEVAQTFTAAQTIANSVAGAFNAFSLRNPDSGASTATQFRIGNDTTAACGYFFATSSNYTGGYGGAGSMNFGANGNVGILAGNILRASILSSGEMAIGGSLATAGNGLLQVGAASSTGKANGIAWATDTFLYRTAANALKTDGELAMVGAQFFYLRGDATTDGSVRFSSPSAGIMTVESRISGTWTEIGRFG